VKKHSAVLIFLSLILASACDQQSINPPFAQGDMFDCHKNASWDSAGIANALIGKWEWEYIACYYAPDQANNKEYQGLEIEFKVDNTLDIIENEIKTQTSTWKLVMEDRGWYGIDANPYVTQLIGRIVLCEDVVEFNKSYIDICDNWFRRMD